jgi:F-type H+-transporting ATPase subunit epsilon
MRLQIVTPLTVETDLDGIVSVRADDATGSFVIWPHHADFLTVLAICVIGWSRAEGKRGHIAVRGGILRVENGELVQVATRQAISGTTLERLGDKVLDQLRQEAEHEAKSRTGSTRMHMGLLRQLDRYLKTRRGCFLQSGGRAPTTLEERAGLEEEPDELWD